MRIFKTLAAQAWFRAILGWLIACYIRLIWWTGRWTVEGATDHLAAWQAGKPFILCFWHGRLLMVPYGWRRGMPIQVLISAHRDGRLIAEAMRYFSIGTRAGSTKRGGAEALRVMLRTLEGGNSIGITPDGPRGPRMRATLGTVAAARLSGVPIIPMAFSFSRRRVLGSWDSFVLALPFGRGVFMWGEAIHVPRDGDVEEYRRRLEAAMNQVAAAADRYCGLVPIEPAEAHVEPRGVEEGADLIGRLYRALTTAAGPAILWYLQRRLVRGKEDRDRFPERKGRSGHPRPPGSLLWCHGASVGETTGALPLLHRIARERPEITLLVTSGTVTAAAMLAERLPARAIHAYVPVDRPAWVARFLDHWRPDAALWMESELWPNLVTDTARRGIPMALLNGRLSARSHRNWQRFAGWARQIMGSFAVILVPDEVQAARFRSLGGHDVRVVGNLKAAAVLADADPDELARLRAGLAGRSCWIAISTHPGEDQIALAAHGRLRVDHPDLMLILVPRHPDRGPAVADIARAAGLPAALRSEGQAIEADTSVYVGNTLGEMGLFLRLADIVLVGGSFDVGRGGHNPLEPALSGAAILHGPDMANFAGVSRRMAEAGAAETVADATALARSVGRLLDDSAGRARRGAAARLIAEEEAGALERTIQALAPILDRLDRRRGGPMRAPEFWQHGGPVATLLRPAGALYAIGGAARRLLSRPWRAPVPVVCVGNLTVGGTGKTPVVLDLARRLATLHPHVVTRGYGGRLAGPVRVDRASHDAADVGDEPLLLAGRAPVWVARDRVAGARAAIAKGAGLVLLDDGFQNPALAKDLSIIVVDGETGFGNGHVFPAGPLREPAAWGIARADLLVIMGDDRHGIAAWSPVPVLSARLVPRMPLSFAPLAPIVAFAGIGRPEKFFATLRSLGARPVAECAFPDHHRFRGEDLLRLEGLAAGFGARLVTTAKDAVRLPPSWRTRVAVLRVAVDWDDAGALGRALARFV